MSENTKTPMLVRCVHAPHGMDPDARGEWVRYDYLASREALLAECRDELEHAADMLRRAPDARTRASIRARMYALLSKLDKGA